MRDMREWGFWEWVAYATLWVGALIIAADGGLKLSSDHLKSFVPDLMESPAWMFAPMTCVLLGTLILVGHGINKKEAPPPALAESFELHLRFFGDNRPPLMISEKNVWRWYSLRNVFTVMTPDGKAQETAITNIFIAFDKPLWAGVARVSSNDYVVSRHEIKEFNQKFAIVTIETTPPGVLDISGGKPP